MMIKCDMHGDYVKKTKGQKELRKLVDGMEMEMEMLMEMLERYKSYVEVNCKNRATCYELVMGLLHSTGSGKDGPKC